MADALLSDADVGLAPAATPAAAPAADPAPPATAPQGDASPPVGQAAPLTIRGSAPPALMSDADVGLAPADSTAAAAQGAGPLSNTQDDGWLSGATKGAATGIIKGAAHIPGWVGDVNDLSRFLAAGAASLFDSRSASAIYADMKAKEAAHDANLPAVLRAPGSNLPNAGDVAAPVLAKIGDYQPTSEAGQLAQAGVEAAVGGLGPGAGGLTKGATLGSAILSTVKQAPLNALAGVAGQGATDATGNPYIGLAASLMAPGAAEGAAHGAVKVAAPFAEDLPVVGRAFTGTREARVGQQIQAAADDPAALRASVGLGDGDTAAAQPALPGSTPTLGQASGDLGILRAEEQARTADNVPFLDRETDQNSARLAALQAATPDGDAMLPSQYLADRAALIEQAGQAAQDRILGHAQGLAAALGPGQGAEVNGGAIRDALDKIDAGAAADDADRVALARAAAAPLGAGNGPVTNGAAIRGALDRVSAASADADAANVGQARAAAAPLGQGNAPEFNGATLRSAQEAAKEQALQLRSNLYAPATLDPEGKINLVMTSAKDVGRSVSDDIDPLGEPPSADVTRILGQVNSLPEVLPYKSAMALDQNITAAMAEERRAKGESANWMRLKELKSGLMGTINDALDNQHAYEQSAVATGRMDPSDTTMARLRGLWDEGDAAGAGSTSDTGRVAAVAGTGPRSQIAGGQGSGAAEGDALRENGRGPQPASSDPELSAQARSGPGVGSDLEARIFHQSVPAEPGHRVVPVDADKVDVLTGWQPDYRIAPGMGGSNGKLARASGFIQGLGDGQDFRPPVLGVHDQGMGFDDGRHRFSAMRDLGFKTVPASMDPASEAAARRLGLVNDAPAKLSSDPRFSAPAYDPDAGLFRAPQRPDFPRPQSLHDFVRRRGGMTDPGGDLAAMGLHQLISKDGVHPDKMREAAAEAGYLGGDTAAAMRDTTPADLLNTLEDGKNAYSARDLDAHLAWEQHDDARAAYDRNRGGDPPLRSAGMRPKAPLSSYGVDDIYPPGTAPAPPGAANGALQPSVDAGFADRLRAAKAAHADYAQTFKQGPVAEDLRTNGFAGQYRTGAGALAGKLLPGGPGGYDTMKARLKAVGDDPAALAALQDQAAAPLRAKVDDGMLPQSAIDAWRAKHDGALRALDEAVPGFSGRFDAAGRAHSLVEAQRSAAALADPTRAYRGDVAAIPASALKPGGAGYDSVKALLDGTGRDPHVVEALQDHALSALREKLQDGMLPQAALDGWRQKYGPALKALDEAAPGFSTSHDAAAAAHGAVMDARAAAAQADVTGRYAGTPAQTITRAIKSGPEGYERLKTLLDATGNDPAVIGAVRDQIVDPLRRGLLHDGTVAPKAHAAWLDSYGPALRALDEVSPGFSKGIGDAAAATDILSRAGAVRQRQMEAFQGSAAAKLLGKTSPDEVGATLLGMLDDAKGGVTKARQVRRALEASPDALAGAQKAAMDAIARRYVNTAESGTSGQKSVASAGLQRFVANRGAALRELLPEHSVNTLQAIAADLERANRDVTGTRIKGTSQTAKNQHGALAAVASGHAGHTALGVAMTEGLMQAYEHGGLHGAALAAVPLVGGLALSKMRSTGASKEQAMFRDALMNPDRARQYLSKVSPDQHYTPYHVAANMLRRELVTTPIVKQASGR